MTAETSVFNFRRNAGNVLYVVVKMRANDDGAGHKAVLLSGPPGIGKTTTAQIVCKVR